jgi:hypothetical protein
MQCLLLKQFKFYFNNFCQHDHCYLKKIGDTDLYMYYVL